MHTWTTVRKGLIINDRVSYGYLAFIWERMVQDGAGSIEMEGGGIEGLSRLFTCVSCRCTGRIRGWKMARSILSPKLVEDTFDVYKFGRYVDRVEYHVKPFWEWQGKVEYTPNDHRLTFYLV